MVAENNVLGAFSQIVVILVVAHLLGALAARYGQPPVIGKIAAGILLGPVVLGHVGPEMYGLVFSEPEALHTLSEIGLALIMFGLGLELGSDGEAGRVGCSKPLLIAAAGAIAAATGGIVIAVGTYETFGGERGIAVYVALVAIAMSATAVPVLGRVMSTLGIANTRVGMTTLLSATITDVFVWLALSVCIAAVATSPSGLPLAGQVAGLLALVLLGEKVLRPVLRHVRALIRRRFGQRTVGELAVPLVAVFVFSIVTERLGLHVLVGAFIAGTIFRSERDLVELWREKVEDFVEAFFVPLYFVAAGVKMELDHAALVPLAIWGLAFFAIGTVGKIGGCYLASRACGFSRRDAYSIGVLMNTKGLVELVILSIGLEFGIISGELYTVLVLVALMSTVITTPLLRTREKSPKEALAKPG